MKVVVDGHEYRVTFANISEKLIHGPDGPKPFKLAIPGRIKALLKDQDNRRYLRIRPQTAASVVTSTCTIWDFDSEAAIRTFVATGQSFYSQSELAAGKPFDRWAAKARSLKRALGQEIHHRTGRSFSQEERHAFWQAFTYLVERRQTQVTQTTRLAQPAPALGDEGLASQHS